MFVFFFWNILQTADLADVPEEGDSSYLLDVNRQRSDSGEFFLHDQCYSETY